MELEDVKVRLEEAEEKDAGLDDGMAICCWHREAQYEMCYWRRRP